MNEEVRDLIEFVAGWFAAVGVCVGFGGTMFCAFVLFLNQLA